MKVLLVTPYSPLVQHDHAANDIALPLVQALAPHMDLHVYAPGQQNGSLSNWQAHGLTFHAGSPVNLSQLDRLGAYPYVARGSWARQSTREVVAIVHKLKPDVLHAEYAQAVEPLLRCRRLVRTSITLHDLPGEIADSERTGVVDVRYLVQRLERIKMRGLKTNILHKVDALFVRSERDRDKIPAARGSVDIAPVGLNAPATGWVGDNPHVAAFGGAMWRAENVDTASYLARDVMPLVRERVSDAQLRIFGARPTSDVRALAAEPGVTVVGEVADYDEEFRRAGVALAPAMVEAGLLMKAIRAMAMGCPVVLNPASADPIVGLENDVHALVGDSSEEIARHVATLMEDRETAVRLGQAGMELVRPHFSWERTVEIYLEVFRRLLAT